MGREIGGDEFHKLLNFLLSQNSGLEFLVGTKTHRAYQRLFTLNKKLETSFSKDEVIIGYIDLFQRNGWCKTLQENKLFPLKFGQQLFQLLNEFIDKKRKFVFQPNGSFPDQLAAFSDLKTKCQPSEDRIRVRSSSRSHASEGRSKVGSSSQNTQPKPFSGVYGGSRGDPFSGDLLKGMLEIDRKSGIPYQTGTNEPLPDPSRNARKSSNLPQRVPTGLLPNGRRESQLYDRGYIRDAEDFQGTRSPRAVLNGGGNQQRDRSKTPNVGSVGQQGDSLRNDRLRSNIATLDSVSLQPKDSIQAEKDFRGAHSSFTPSNGHNKLRERTRGRSSTPSVFRIGSPLNGSSNGRSAAEQVHRTHFPLNVSKTPEEHSKRRSGTPNGRGDPSKGAVVSNSVNPDHSMGSISCLTNASIFSTSVADRFMDSYRVSLSSMIETSYKFDWNEFKAFYQKVKGVDIGLKEAVTSLKLREGEQGVKINPILIEFQLEQKGYLPKDRRLFPKFREFLQSFKYQGEVGEYRFYIDHSELIEDATFASGFYDEQQLLEQIRSWYNSDDMDFFVKIFNDFPLSARREVNQLKVSRLLSKCNESVTRMVEGNTVPLQSSNADAIFDQLCSVLQKTPAEELLDKAVQQGLLKGVTRDEMTKLSIIVDKSLVRNYKLNANIANIPEFYIKDKSYRENFTKAVEKIKINIAERRAQEQLAEIYEKVKLNVLEIVASIISKDNISLIISKTDILVTLNDQLKDKIYSHAIAEFMNICFSRNSEKIFLKSLASFVAISKILDTEDSSIQNAREFYLALLANEQVVGFLKSIDISILDANDLTPEDIDQVNKYLVDIDCSTMLKTPELVDVQRGQRAAAEVTASHSTTAVSFEGKDVLDAYAQLSQLASRTDGQHSFQVFANEFVTYYYKDKQLDHDQLFQNILALVDINDNFSEDFSMMIFSNSDLKGFVKKYAEFLKQPASEDIVLCDLLKKIDPEFGVSAKGASLTR